MKQSLETQGTSSVLQEHTLVPTTGIYKRKHKVPTHPTSDPADDTAKQTVCVRGSLWGCQGRTRN